MTVRKAKKAAFAHRAIQRKVAGGWAERSGYAPLVPSFAADA